MVIIPEWPFSGDGLFEPQHFLKLQQFFLRLVVSTMHREKQPLGCLIVSLAFVSHPRHGSCAHLVWEYSRKLYCGDVKDAHNACGFPPMVPWTCSPEAGGIADICYGKSHFLSRQVPKIIWNSDSCLCIFASLTFLTIWNLLLSSSLIN